MVTPWLADADFTLYQGDVLDVLPTLPAGSVHCCVTSPPYWGLRDYGAEGQLGLEETPEEYVDRMVRVFREARRVLRDDGTLWLNLGDSYSHGGNGSRDPIRWPKQSRNDHRVAHTKAAGDTKPKDLLGIPWRVAFALQADGWYLRADIIWSKPNPMPESVTDRPTKAHEYLFLLSKSARYFYDADAIREPLAEATIADARFAKATARNMEQAADRYGEGTSASRRSAGSFFNPKGATYAEASPKAAGLGSGPRVKFAPERNDGDPDSMYKHPSPLGRNKRSVWEVATEPYPDAHFATYPQALIRPCILAGCPEGGTVLDPFLGSGTTALVARRHSRKSIGIELNPAYAQLAARRLGQQSLLTEGAA